MYMELYICEINELSILKQMVGICHFFVSLIIRHDRQVIHKYCICSLKKSEIKVNNE